VKQKGAFLQLWICSDLDLGLQGLQNREKQISIIFEITQCKILCFNSPNRTKTKGFLRHRLLVPISNIYHLVSLEWSLRICIPDNFSGNIDAAGLGNTFWELLLYSCRQITCIASKFLPFAKYYFIWFCTTLFSYKVHTIPLYWCALIHLIS
jgi:hypothetical protein